MRLLAFYFTVAFLAFGIGILIVSKFYQKSENTIINVVETKIIQDKKNISKDFGTGSATSDRLMNEPVYVPKLHKPTCSDKKLLPIWNELKKDKEFKEREKEFYQKADCSEMLHIQKADLNDDGQKEIILSGNNSNLCDAAFSCFYWIFEKKGNKYKQILRSTATGYNEIANYTIKRGIEIGKTKSNGYRAIILRGGPGYQTFQSTFRFEDNKYEEKECLTFDVVLNNKDWVRSCKEAWKE